MSIHKACRDGGTHYMACPCREEAIRELAQAAFVYFDVSVDSTLLQNAASERLGAALDRIEELYHPGYLHPVAQ